MRTTTSVNCRRATVLLLSLTALTGGCKHALEPSARLAPTAQATVVLSITPRTGTPILSPETPTTGPAAEQTLAQTVSQHMTAIASAETWKAILTDGRQAKDLPAIAPPGSKPANYLRTQPGPGPGLFRLHAFNFATAEAAATFVDAYAQAYVDTKSDAATKGPPAEDSFFQSESSYHNILHTWAYRPINIRRFSNGKANTHIAKGMALWRAHRIILDNGGYDFSRTVGILSTRITRWYKLPDGTVVAVYAIPDPARDKPYLSGVMQTKDNKTINASFHAAGGGSTRSVVEAIEVGLEGQGYGDKLRWFKNQDKHRHVDHLDLSPHTKRKKEPVNKDDPLKWD
ncbi:MAG: hypothetical protein QGH60_02225 [Phycisphaerae bacterium]|jgi:hypothetical protein|nr:hypothetical protein [Phycisphaerae bacterium]